MPVKISPMRSAEFFRRFIRYIPETGEFIVLRDAVVLFISPRGYWCVRICGREWLAHRVAWLLMTGREPKDEIDHINGNRSDNRWQNLREASHAENMRNRAADRDKGVPLKGVFFNKRLGKYNAQIVVNGRSIWLGTFNYPAAAHFAYVIAADKHHREFARTA